MSVARQPFLTRSFLFSECGLLVRGDSLISHLLLLVASRHWHVHWHSESRPTDSTLDCEDCQLIQANFDKSLESDEAVPRADLEGPVE